MNYKRRKDETAKWLYLALIIVLTVTVVILAVLLVLSGGLLLWLSPLSLV